MSEWKQKMKAAHAAKAAAEAEVETLQARVKQACAVRDAAEAKAKAAEEEIRAARNEALLSILTPEIVDILAPEHDRPDDDRCTDAASLNDLDGCARCALLNAIITAKMPGSGWRFSVDPVRS